MLYFGLFGLRDFVALFCGLLRLFLFFAFVKDRIMNLSRNFDLFMILILHQEFHLMNEIIETLLLKFVFKVSWIDDFKVILLCPAPLAVIRFRP